MIPDSDAGDVSDNPEMISRPVDINKSQIKYSDDEYVPDSDAGEASNNHEMIPRPVNVNKNQMKYCDDEYHIIHSKSTCSR